MSFRALLGLILALAVIGAVGWTALAAGRMLTTSGEEVERARVARVLAGLAATTETNLSIGLSLDNLGMLQPQLERERSADPRLLALDIFSIGGRSAFSTDRSAIGESVPESWVAAARADTAAIWRVQERGEIAYGRTVFNDLGMSVAGIALTLSAADRQRTTHDIAVRIAVLALPVLLVCSLLATLTGFAVGSWSERPFGRIARLMASVEGPPATQGSRVEQEASAAARAWSEAAGQLGGRLRRLEILDD